MSFDAHEEKIRKILSGDTRFTIPRNQRRYVWTEKQWKELLDDVIYIKKCREKNGNEVNHFLGTFVLQEEGNKFEIIDGQQRITTILLMLSSMCMIFNEKESEEEHGVTRQYLSGNIGLMSQYMRIVNEVNTNINVILSNACRYRDDLKKEQLLDYNLIKHTNDGNINALQCFEFYYNYFSDYCDTIQQLVEIRNIVLDMKVIHISSENELDCYDIFEILNARGVELEESELLKNYIFKYAQPEYTVDRAKEIWEKIEYNINIYKGNLDLFLTHFVTYRYCKPTKEENVFRLIKYNVGKENVNDLLDDLYASSEQYIKFYNPSSEENGCIRECLEFLKLLNHRLFRPLIMALFNAVEAGYYTEKQMQEICLFLKNFAFAYTMIMGQTSNMIETKVHELSNKIYQYHTSEVLNEVKQTLMVYYPAYGEFESAFFNFGFSNKNRKYKNSNNRKRMYYLFRTIEEYYQQTDELICNISECNIEHIMNDSETEDIVAKAGNLLLISESINNNMGNASFSDKKKKMKKSQMITVNNFLSYYGECDDWDNSLIEKRTKSIAKLAYSKVWKI